MLLPALSANHSTAHLSPAARFTLDSVASDARLRGLDVFCSEPTTIKPTGLITKQQWAGPGPATCCAHARSLVLRKPTPPTRRHSSNIIVSSPSGKIICCHCAAASCCHRWRRSTAAHLKVESRSRLCVQNICRQVKMSTVLKRKVLEITRRVK